MQSAVFLTRVVLHNYKSIGTCDVRPGPLTCLVGANGAGKSNFLDALHFVRDALAGSLEQALAVHGGLAGVRRRCGAGAQSPADFGVRLEFNLDAATSGHYAFAIGPAPRGGPSSHAVQTEECELGTNGQSAHFRIEHGALCSGSQAPFPAIDAQQLALARACSIPAFRPVFDALTSMAFYRLAPRLMREAQPPQNARLLQPGGENITSVLERLVRVAPQRMDKIAQYLQIITPTVHGMERVPLGERETLRFHQEMASGGADFLAQHMSDGTLRALGVLTALFQGNCEYAPRLVALEEPEAALHPGESAALREALSAASRHTQVMVTSHGSDLLDSPKISAGQLLAVVSQDGQTQIAPLDQASRSVMRDQMFTAGELLRLHQLDIDRGLLEEQRQAELFGELVT